MNDPDKSSDDQYTQALNAVERTLDKLHGCNEEELVQLRADFKQLKEMDQKLRNGRVEIAVFGEISTGKSALINALLGRNVADVDVQGGWTKQVWGVAWEGCGYVVPGLADSQVVLIDTPGLNEVGGADRAEMARQAAQRADLILFVTDSDLNDCEFSALLTLTAASKPIIVVLNKVDLYSKTQRDRLLEILRTDRLEGIIPADDVVATMADPREVEVITESADGSTRSQWRSPDPDVQQLKARVIEVLEQDGMELLALNAAMYAADKSDRIAAVRVQVRDRQANQLISSFAAIKSAAVALNPYPVADVLGGGLVDVTMVASLAHVYGLEMSWQNARTLVTSIFKAAGVTVGGYMLGEAMLHSAVALFKAVTIGYGTILTAVPQGAAAGFGSYIVGQSAKYYFEHGSSWGGQSPKVVVCRILEQTDKKSVIVGLKEEIKKKLQRNRHAGRAN